MASIDLSQDCSLTHKPLLELSKSHHNKNPRIPYIFAKVGEDFFDAHTFHSKLLKNFTLPSQEIQYYYKVKDSVSEWMIGHGIKECVPLEENENISAEGLVWTILLLNQKLSYADREEIEEQQETLLQELPENCFDTDHETVQLLEQVLSVNPKSCASYLRLAFFYNFGIDGGKKNPELAKKTLLQAFESKKTIKKKNKEMHRRDSSAPQISPRVAEMISSKKPSTPRSAELAPRRRVTSFSEKQESASPRSAELSSPRRRVTSFSEKPDSASPRRRASLGTSLDPDILRIEKSKQVIKWVQEMDLKNKTAFYLLKFFLNREEGELEFSFDELLKAILEITGQEYLLEDLQEPFIKAEGVAALLSAIELLKYFDLSQREVLQKTLNVKIALEQANFSEAEKCLKSLLDDPWNLFAKEKLAALLSEGKPGVEKDQALAIDLYTSLLPFTKGVEIKIRLADLLTAQKKPADFLKGLEIYREILKDDSQNNDVRRKLAVGYIEGVIPNLPEAIFHLRELLRIDPGDFFANSRMGLLQEKEEYYQKAYTKNSEDLFLLANYGFFLVIRDPHRAYDLLSKALKKDPQHEKVIIGLDKLAEKGLGSRRISRNSINEAAKRNSQNPEIHFRARAPSISEEVNFQKKPRDVNVDRSLELVEIEYKKLKEEKKPIELFMLLQIADLCLQSSEESYLERAKVILEEADKLAAGKIEVIEKWVEYYLKRENFAKVRELLEDFMKSEKKSPYFAAQLALLCVEEELSEKLIEEALKTPSKDILVKAVEYYLTTSAKKPENRQKASDTVKHLARVNPKDPTLVNFCIQLAELCFPIKDKWDVKASWEIKPRPVKSVEKLPNVAESLWDLALTVERHPQALAGLANFYLDNDKIKEAEELFKECLALEPHNLDALCGMVLLNWDERTLAQEYNEKILKLHPFNKFARQCRDQLR